MNTIPLIWKKLLFSIWKSRSFAKKEDHASNQNAKCTHETCKKHSEKQLLLLLFRPIHFILVLLSVNMTVRGTSIFYNYITDRQMITVFSGRAPDVTYADILCNLIMWQNMTILQNNTMEAFMCPWNSIVWGFSWASRMKKNGVLIYKTDKYCDCETWAIFFCLAV